MVIVGQVQQPVDALPSRGEVVLGQDCAAAPVMCGSAKALAAMARIARRSTFEQSVSSGFLLARDKAPNKMAESKPSV